MSTVGISLPLAVDFSWYSPGILFVLPVSKSAFLCETTTSSKIATYTLGKRNVLAKQARSVLGWLYVFLRIGRAQPDLSMQQCDNDSFCLPTCKCATKRSDYILSLTPPNVAVIGLKEQEPEATLFICSWAKFLLHYISWFVILSVSLKIF